MLEVCEVGNAVSREDYEAAIPELRVGLINAQYDLRDAAQRSEPRRSAAIRLGCAALVAFECVQNQDAGTELVGP